MTGWWRRPTVIALACVAVALVAKVDPVIGQTPVTAPTTVAAARDFPSIVVSSALSIGAIVFGVFGFLYSVYAMYSSMATPDNSARAPIVKDVRRLCRILAVLLISNMVLTAGALILMWPADGPGQALAVGLGGLTLAIAGISGMIAFSWMK